MAGNTHAVAASCKRQLAARHCARCQYTADSLQLPSSAAPDPGSRRDETGRGLGLGPVAPGEGARAGGDCAGRHRLAVNGGLLVGWCCDLEGHRDALGGVGVACACQRGRYSAGRVRFESSLPRPADTGRDSPGRVHNGPTQSAGGGRLAGPGAGRGAAAADWQGGEAASRLALPVPAVEPRSSHSCSAHPTSKMYAAPESCSGRGGRESLCRRRGRECNSSAIVETEERLSMQAERP